MISEERVKDLWLHRDNIHDGDLVAQLCDLARKIEVEVAAPLEARINGLIALDKERLCEICGYAEHHREHTDSAQVILERDTLALQNKRYREVLLKLACLGNGEQYGNSVGNYIAQDALSIPDLSTSIIKHDNDVIERCAVLCEKSDRYRGDYFAEKIRALKQ